jgi:hypothetical protein
MKSKLTQVALAGLLAAAVGLGSTAQPAKADDNTLGYALGAAALAAGVLTAENVAHKNQMSSTVQGYLPNGGVVYEDGHIVLPNGQSYYPSSSGKQVTCNGQQCYIVGGGPGFGYPGNYGYNGGNTGYYGNSGYYGNTGAYGNTGYYGNGGYNNGYYGNGGYNNGYYGNGGYNNGYYNNPPQPYRVPSPYTNGTRYITPAGHVVRTRVTDRGTVTRVTTASGHYSNR